VSLGAAVVAFLYNWPFVRIRSAELLPAQWPQATFATECWTSPSQCKITSIRTGC